MVVDGKPVKGEQGPVEVKANSEARVDWLVNAAQATEAKLKVEARGEKYADAMEKTFTIYEHGIEKFVSRPGKMRGDSVTVKLDIPKGGGLTRPRLRSGCAQLGNHDARCAALPHLLSVGLYRTDDESFSPGRDHGQNAPRHRTETGNGDEQDLWRDRTVNCLCDSS
jgi:hypothetical protein